LESFYVFRRRVPVVVDYSGEHLDISTF
jgi:hypothetical protein